VDLQIRAELRLFLPTRYAFAIKRTTESLNLTDRGLYLPALSPEVLDCTSYRISVGSLFCPLSPEVFRQA
jgi:hypothetical protein